VARRGSHVARCGSLSGSVGGLTWLDVVRARLMAQALAWWLDVVVRLVV
jgi:hypothetical protein